jgi:hypothetical protein
MLRWYYFKVEINERTSSDHYGVVVKEFRITVTSKFGSIQHPKDFSGTSLRSEITTTKIMNFLPNPPHNPKRSVEKPSFENPGHQKHSQICKLAQVY